MLTLYAHPFSAYCWKALIPLYEAGTAFDYRRLGDPGVDADRIALWPIGRFPVLVADGRTIAETSIIVEYLDLHHPGPVRMIPADPAAAIDVRMLDRVFDNYVTTPMQKIVGDAARPADARDPHGLAEAHAMIETAYRWLDARIGGADWPTGGFGLVECAAAPALFYADWVHPIPEPLAALRGYRARLLARPSIARAVDEARPFRGWFPPGAPERD